jgi:hypothetical protein
MVAVSVRPLSEIMTRTDKKKLRRVVLTAWLLLSAFLVSLTAVSAESASGTIVIVVAPSSKESIMQVLAIGDKITVKITVSGGDNYIICKLYDPAGNPRISRQVQPSLEFSWGPVEYGGEYRFELDNWADPSSRNTVYFEYQITSTLDTPFPNPTILILAGVLAAIVIPVVVVLRRRDKKNHHAP